MRLLRGIVLLGALSAAAACEGLLEPVEEDVAGTYTLQAINNSALPFSMYLTIASSSVVLGGEIVIRDDGSFRLSTRSVDRIGPVGEPHTMVDTVTRVFDGTYSRQGRSVRLDYGGLEDSASVRGRALTRMAPGGTAGVAMVPWVYAR
jgi:hypothetical protein